VVADIHRDRFHESGYLRVKIDVLVWEKLRSQDHVLDQIRARRFCHGHRRRRTVFVLPGTQEEMDSNPDHSGNQNHGDDEPEFPPAWWPDFLRIFGVRRCRSRGCGGAVSHRSGFGHGS